MQTPVFLCKSGIYMGIHFTDDVQIFLSALKKLNDGGVKQVIFSLTMSKSQLYICMR